MSDSPIRVLVPSAALGRLHEALIVCSSANGDVFDVIAAWSAENLPPLCPENDDNPMLMHIACQLWHVEEGDDQRMGDATRVAFQIAQVYYEAAKNPSDMLCALLLAATTLAIDRETSETDAA